MGRVPSRRKDQAKGRGCSRGLSAWALSAPATAPALGPVLPSPPECRGLYRALPPRGLLGLL